MLRPIISLFIAAAALAACNPYSPDLGTDPFLCSKTEHLCPEGYECDGDTDESICIAAAPSDDVDATGGNFQCANDSSIEPNNDPGTAFVTPIPSMTSYSLVGLSVCPVGDRDHYRFRIDTAGTNFEAQVTGVANRSSLSLQVLTATGTMVASGSSVSGSPQVVRIEVINRLAAENYVVLVQSADNTENNYDLTMKICATTPPCP